MWCYWVMIISTVIQSSPQSNFRTFLSKAILWTKAQNEGVWHPPASLEKPASSTYKSTSGPLHTDSLLLKASILLTHSGWGQRLHINSTLQWTPVDDAASLSSWCPVTGPCWSQGSLWFLAVFCSCFSTSQLLITRTKGGQEGIHNPNQQITQTLL